MENARIAALTGILMGLTGCMARPLSPIQAAAAQGDMIGLQALLASGAPADGFGEDGLTPLMWAARKGRTVTMRALLDAGAEIDRRDTHLWGWTPLLHAIHKGQTDSVRLLIERGADVNAPANNGLTPLIAAAGGCDCEGDRGERDLDDIVALLLEKGADPRSETHDGSNALTNAVAAGRTAIVKTLLAKAPDLRVRDNLLGEVSLLIALVRGRTEIVSLVRKAR